MQITGNTQAFLDPIYAPALRFMQDQPMVHARDFAYQAVSFPTKVAQFVEHIGFTKKQREALDRMIERTGWVEPPRFRPFAELIQRDPVPLYRVTCCPGLTIDEVFDDIQALARLKPAGAKHEVTIGPLYEYTHDVDDPRLDRTPSEKKRGLKANYTTVCRRLVEEASQRGKLIEYRVTETGK